MSDHLTKPHDRMKYRTQGSDRRGITFIERPDDKRLIICPEPFPGALVARGASSSLTVTDIVAGTDAITGAVQAVDGRPGAMRLYEVKAYELCLRYQDGTYSKAEYMERQDRSTEWAFAALGIDAAKVAAASAAAAKIAGASTASPKKAAE